MLRETMTSTMPVAMIATTAVWTERVMMFAGVRIRAAGHDAEADPDGGQRDEHAEQAQIDLRLPRPAVAGSAAARCVWVRRWCGAASGRSLRLPPSLLSPPAKAGTAPCVIGDSRPSS